MATFRTRLQVLAVFMALLGLSGCPLFVATPKLAVLPAAVSFTPAQFVRTLTISNEGGGFLNWTLEEVTREDDSAPWVASEVSWLVSDVESGSTGAQNSLVELTVDRRGLPAGIISNAGIRVISNVGEVVVPISLAVELIVYPSTTVISLEPADFSLTFDIINDGNSIANWELFYVPEPGNPDSATSFPLGFDIDPGISGTTPIGESTTVDISWTPPTPPFDILLVTSNGNTLISVTFDAFIPNLIISPDPVILYVSSDSTATEQPISKLTLQNTGFAAINVSIDARHIRTSPTDPPISVNPPSKIIEPGAIEEIQLQVTDPETIEFGTGFYELVLFAGGKFTRVSLEVQLAILPEIVISDIPIPTNTIPEIIPLSLLDFGTESYQKSFYIVNTGLIGSDLFFKIRVIGNDATETPIILDVTPSFGDTNKNEPDFSILAENRTVDGELITVTIDRGALVEDVTVLELVVEATKSDHTTLIEAVAPVTIPIQIVRPPLTIEGALNRSRPPNMSRWVFLVRDRQGNVVPAQTQEDFEKLEFNIFENDLPLDLDETNQFIGKPKSINLAIVLDYTASLFNAGTDLSVNPLARGEATQNMIDATKELIADLPPNTRIGLYYHHDRSQSSYVMHQFTNDRASLIQRLDDFTLPVAQYGSTKIYDALAVAVQGVISEDASDALPFDETDVRAVLFVTDGADNSSLLGASEVLSLAQPNQVRLFPVTYDPGTSGPLTADLVSLATESGGHFYNAGANVLNLDKVLANASGLTFTPVSESEEEKEYFVVSNPTGSTMNLTIDVNGFHPWLSVSPASATLLPGATAQITVTAEASPIPVGTSAQAEIFVTSNLGRGHVYVDVTRTSDVLTPTVGSLALTLSDQPGKFWDDLQNQFVFTYNTPRQESISYNIEVRYTQPDDEVISGFFTDDFFFYFGDSRAGQISMLTDGITSDNRAEVHVRADFVPRNVTRLKMRFYTQLPINTPAAAVTAFADVQMTVSLDDKDSLLLPADPNAQSWNLVDEGDGVYLALTEQDNPLPFSAFGNLLKLTFSNLEPFIAAFDGLSQRPEFYVEMRVDNDIYYSPASPTTPSDTKYFLYPSGVLNPARPLSVGVRPDLAAPAQNVEQLNQFIILDPEAPLAFDMDEDGFPDFNDPYPFNEDLPSNVSAPNLIEIAGTEDTTTFTVRNNRLDTFTWAVDPASLAAAPWLSVDPSGGILAPGQSQQVTLNVDRTGLDWGVYHVELELGLGVFVEEFVPVSMTVLQP